MKSKLIKGLTSLLFAVLAWVSLAFPFGVEVIKSKSGTASNVFYLDDWFLVMDINQVQIWQISRIFMFIALSLILITAIGAIIRIFINNKITTTIVKVFGFTGLFMMILFLVLFLCGGLTYAQSISTKELKYFYYLHAGVSILCLAGLISLCFAIPWKKEKLDKNTTKEKGEKNEKIVD